MGRTKVLISPKQGNWQVQRGAQVLSEHGTRKAAIKAGIPVAKDAQGQLVIQGRDGKIREERTYGKDPYPPKG